MTICVFQHLIHFWWTPPQLLMSPLCPVNLYVYTPSTSDVLRCNWYERGHDVKWFIHSFEQFAHIISIFPMRCRCDVKQCLACVDKKICILYGFPVRWIFLTTSLRIPPESRSDEGGIRRRVVRNPSHMENHTKCIFSHTLHFNAL